MTMMRWDPFRERGGLRHLVDKLVDESLIRPSQWLESLAGDFPLDIYESNGDIVVRAALPGIKPDDVEISVSGDTLTIRGEHKEEEQVREDSYFRRELRYGGLSRSVPLPMEVQSDKAEATYEDGMLTVSLPKGDKQKPRQIKMKPAKAVEAKK
jgi:HSP20 family protein